MTGLVLETQCCSDEEQERGWDEPIDDEDLLDYVARPDDWDDDEDGDWDEYLLKSQVIRLARVSAGPLLLDVHAGSAGPLLLDDIAGSAGPLLLDAIAGSAGPLLLHDSAGSVGPLLVDDGAGSVGPLLLHDYREVTF